MLSVTQPRVSEQKKKNNPAVGAPLPVSSTPLSGRRFLLRSGIRVILRARGDVSAVRSEGVGSGTSPPRPWSRRKCGGSLGFSHPPPRQADYPYEGMRRQETVVLTEHYGIGLRTRCGYGQFVILLYDRLIDED